MRLEKFKCGECGCIFVVDTRKWHMNWCPKCEKTAVDLEETYCRLIGNKFPKQVDTFEPPWFTDEDNYHSALLGWLNDSDEKYSLYKDGEFTLTIYRH